MPCPKCAALREQVDDLKLEIRALEAENEILAGKPDRDNWVLKREYRRAMAKAEYWEQKAREAGVRE